MSLAQKLSLLEWVTTAGQPQTATLPGVRRLGIPVLHLAEGQLGSARQASAAMTAPLGVAATFSRADAYANGVVLGRDARALRQQVVARPFGVIDTGGTGAAAAASYGEDPLLAGGTAAAEIAGIQAQGTMAVADGCPSGLGSPGVVPGSAALHEIYLHPFEDAVRAGVAGVLCSPAGTGTAGRGTTGGTAATLIQDLRGELGFTGFVLAGPGASPGTLSIDSGVDGEVPAAGRAAARYFTPAALRAAIAGKTVSIATVNQAVAAVLTAMDRFGLLGPQPVHGAPAEPAAADERVISRTAADAATLLKNSGHALPLSPAALSSVALIGPGADQVIGADPAGGYGAGIAARQTGTLQALRQDLAPSPAARLSFAVGDDMTGTPVPAALLTHEGLPGLVRSTTGHDATQVVSTLENTVADHDALPAGSGHSWAGELTVPATGTYWISVGTGGSWGALTLDGTLVARDGPGQAARPATATAHATDGAAGSTLPDESTLPDGSTTAPAAPAPAGSALVPATDGLDNLRARVTLTAGIHTLGVTESPDGSGRPVQVRLSWVTPAAQQAGLAAAMTAARAAGAAVVFAWSAGGTHLPDGQDQLIQDVAAVNPDTVVVLNTPGPVAMPWLGAVRAVLEMWYPGDAGGEATAAVLLGRDDPAGRLPVTWPAAHKRPRRNRPTGIFVGYRRYDRDGIAPLFPFGYGMSYTRFGYSGLTWHATPGRGLVVRFTLADTGPLAGTAVPQVYLGPPASTPPGAAFAPRALAAYTRIGLRPGQSRVVTLTVPQRELQYWQDARGWVTAAGRRRLYVGSDERSSALTVTVTIPR
jgi:beta-glucosidase